MQERESVVMSTYFFKTNLNNLGSVSQLKPHLDKLEQDKTIERWHVDFNNPEHILEIETNKLSPEEVKHLLRAAGLEVDFTKAPQAR
jgi:hypothetical protein